jgi:hypothetical protein
MSKASQEGFREGLMARRDGKPRQSPYAGIRAFRVLHGNWLEGWDAEDRVACTRVALAPDNTTQFR